MVFGAFNWRRCCLLLFVHCTNRREALAANGVNVFSNIFMNSSIFCPYHWLKTRAHAHRNKKKKNNGCWLFSLRLLISLQHRWTFFVRFVCIKPPGKRLLKRIDYTFIFISIRVPLFISNQLNCLCHSYLKFFACGKDHTNIKFQCQFFRKIRVWLCDINQPDCYDSLHASFRNRCEVHAWNSQQYTHF